MILGIALPNTDVLWSGTIGSFTSAVIGGFVALGVVRLTTRNQSKLAAISRENAAIADLIASADTLITEYSWGVKPIDDASNAIGAAAARWCMELSDTEMASELLLLPPHLGRLAFHANKAEENGADEITQEFDALRRSVSRLKFLCLAWPKADKRQRIAIVRQLRESRIDTGGDPDLIRSSRENGLQSG